MKNFSKYIAVEGPIGVGKSSLVSMMGQSLETEPIFEVVEDNPFLEKFYNDPRSHAFTTQMFFLMSRYRQLSYLSQVDLFNQATLCDYLFERDLLFAKLNLDESEFDLYREVFDLLKKRLPQPDLVVFLQADTPTLMKRIRKRRRSIESKVTEEYIDNVNQVFNEHFFNYKGGPLLIINTNQIDFVHNSEDFNNLMTKVTGTVRGVEFFNPPASLL